MKWNFCLLIFTLTTSQAFATLGQPIESVSSNLRSLSAKSSNSDIFKKYSVHRMDSDSTSVRQYAGNDGVVFGVAWSGLNHPDLSVLLGSYFKSYQSEENNAVRIHGVRHQTLSAENLVVQKWGHMRDLEGRAYDPSLIPAGVSIDEIK